MNKTFKRLHVANAMAQVLSLVPLAGRESERPMPINKGTSKERLDAQRRVQRMKDLFGNELDGKVSMEKAKILLHNHRIEEKKAEKKALKQRQFQSDLRKAFVK